MAKVDRARRQAAGHICISLFHTVMTAGHMMRKISAPAKADQVGTFQFLGLGLTEAEREWVDRLSKRLLDDAEQMRKLGQRLLQDGTRPPHLQRTTQRRRF